MATKITPPGGIFELQSLFTRPPPTAEKPFIQALSQVWLNTGISVPTGARDDTVH